MRSNVLALFLILLASRESCFAQTSDYVLTAKGDSIPGRVKIMAFETDQVQVTVDKKKKIYQAYQIKKLRLAGSTYSVQKRANQYRFMTIIKSGYLSLYGYREPNQNNYDGRFLVKKDGEAIDVPNLGFKKFMGSFLKECPQVSSDVKNGPLGRRDIERIVEQYNLCVEASTRRNAVPSATTTPTGQIVTPSNKLKLDAIINLRKKLSSAPDFANKKNALDLVSDMETKVTSNSVVPPYLLEGLKGYIGNRDEFKEDLDAVFRQLETN